ncbi:MAG: TlpA disulfide reductase family protein [Bacteroidales bacterium]|nr:TlpA disulfide reductase family protein [Bacteroidales bacterium]
MILCIASFFATSLTLSAQDQPSVTLNVGDKAPELRYGKWIKGTQINEYSKGRLYIVEFWATWCGPCKMAMPHLSKLAKEREKDITVIGVNIWEGGHDSNKQTPDAYLPKITRFVENMGDNMAYNVITDNNEEFMGNNWMKAAGQDGIPCSFMIKDSTILWIGHPIALDSIIQVVMDDKYDVAAERQKRIKAGEEKLKGPEAAFGKIYAAMEEAVKEGQYNRAIAIVDSGIVEIPSWAAPLNFFKFQTLIDHFEEKEAMSFVREWQETNPGFKGSVGAVIARKEGLSKESYLYAVKLLTELIDNPQPGFAMYSEIAVAYVNMGDFKGAVEAQEKAVAAAKQGLKENKYPGFITEDTIKEYEEVLAGYKTKLK